MMMMMAMMMVIESDLGVTSPMLVTLSSSLCDKHIIDILCENYEKNIIRRAIKRFIWDKMSTSTPCVLGRQKV